jgi:hypothetical protein
MLDMADKLHLRYSSSLQLGKPWETTQL